MAEAAKKIETNPVADAARAALETNSEDVVAAAKALATKVRKSRKLRDEITDPLIDSACYEAVCAIIRQTRAHIWTAPNYDAGGKGDRLRIVASNALMDFPLPGGKRLGNATRSELSEASDFYEKQAKNMGHKGRWLRLVAQSIPSDKIASEVLNEARLHELQEQADE